MRGSDGQHERGSSVPCAAPPPPTPALLSASLLGLLGPSRGGGVCGECVCVWQHLPPPSPHTPTHTPHAHLMTSDWEMMWVSCPAPSNRARRCTTGRERVPPNTTDLGVGGCGVGWGRGKKGSLPGREQRCSARTPLPPSPLPSLTCCRAGGGSRRAQSRAGRPWWRRPRRKTSRRCL